MTEESSGVQSTKVLIVALVIGAIVAIVYNLHIYNIRKQSQPVMAEVLCFDHDMFAGDRIRPGKDIAVKRVPKSVTESLDGVVKKEALAKVEQDGVLNQDVRKGQLVFWHHVTADERTAPSWGIGKGKVVVALPLDSQRVQGDILRVGDLVNVLGLFSLDKKGPIRTYRIIEGVQVHAIGGKGIKGPGGSRRSSSAGLRSYRTISVAVDKGNDVSLALSNLLTHAQGKEVWFELRNPKERLGSNAGQINPDLVKLAKTAAGRKIGPGGLSPANPTRPDR